MSGYQSHDHLTKRGKGRIIDESFDDKYYVIPEEDIRYFEKKV